ncbi:hypothetical protein DL764_004960 [Monosporascus ibericus]|uniref:Spindle pole body component n=1 Tax=Monosporascus ibericus TaxID=155417 RepID=A0A4V1XAR8_9PEZI|nr:hypothetical protein DL764_004960 [Monosporascus ibericus]
MADEDPADVFAFPDFGKPSKWSNLKPLPNEGSEFFSLHIQSPEQKIRAPESADIKPPTIEQDGFFKLPPLLERDSSISDEDQKLHPSQSFIWTPLHDTELPDLDIFEDVWFQSGEQSLPTSEFKTWDGFMIPELPACAPLFITEAGPGVYDAALSSSDDPLSLKNADRNVIQTNPFIAALLALALGRGSVFFVWDEKSASFVQNAHKMRIPGYSSEVLQGFQDACLQCGAMTRFLSHYVRINYQTHSSPVRVALAKVVDTLLLVIQTNLGERARQIHSLLQLQSVVQPIQGILAHFKSLVTKESRLKFDEHVLSTIFEETQALEHLDEHLAKLMREVLARISEPWTDFAGKWIGVKDEDGVPLTKEEPGKGFVKVERISYVDDFGFEVEELDYVLDEDRMPSFIPREVASAMFEAGRNLRLLRTHHPEHPLCRPGLISSSKPPPFRWHFDWETINQLQEDVTAYEKSISQTVGQLTVAPSQGPDMVEQNLPLGEYDMQLFGQDGAKLEARLLASIQMLDQPPSLFDKEDGLSQLLRRQLFESHDDVPQQAATGFTPHWSLIPIHSFGPLVAAQARLVNREYMRLLFDAHRLREHLLIQKQFQLLGNGMFCSRLSHALFDPDLEAAEREAGVARKGGTMGLRLSGRETWPPASSELRLALMGVLTEAYLSASPAPVGPDAEKQSILDDLSFAVRDLSPEEIDRCMDPGSLEALDFLRLSYKPPPPLSPVITPAILVKYDKIFKLLLRILRMLYVVGQISRDILAHTSKWDVLDNVSVRFHFEAQHFITNISTYFFDTGIEIPWRRFESWLEEVEADIVKPVSDHKEARVVSPNELREEHERMLDHIMHTLLLRKRQQAVMKLLEDIFTSVLRFSKRTRLAASGKDADGVEGPSSKGLYDAFKKKVDVFITVCRGLSEKGGHVRNMTRNDLMGNEKQMGATREENTIDRLLIKLEMSGHYSQSRI